jgi:glucosamine--fructose-6-phosphate aminotransferase (isomerizing)
LSLRILSRKDTMTSHLQTEILSQPDVLYRLLTEGRAAVEAAADAIRAANPRFVVLAARGTSDNAARYSQYLFSTINGLQAALATPSTFTIYQKPPSLQDSLVLAISQSGQSPDIVTVVEEGRRQGALTIAVTNAPDSPLAHAAAHSLHIHAGAEIAVAATKTYTTSLLTLAMLSNALAGGSADVLGFIPSWAAEVTRHAETIVRAAERYAYMEYCVVASRGYNYATAHEIALKLKELTYIMAEPYSSADFQHGPVALVEHGFPLLAVVPDGVLRAELTSFFKGLRDERGADLIVVSADQEALATATTPLPLPSGIPEWLSPIIAVIPGQLFALGLTLAKRLNPDQPRGLRKVTLTA